MAPTVEVLLHSIDGLDEFEQRKLILAPLETVPIGRSSKNATKNLMAAADNAFINSPVISREHATLSASAANTASDIPLAVYITDNGSMHGTYINGSRLQRGVASQLASGDTLRFGDNVVRDQDSFIAKTYRFSSRVAMPPLPAVMTGRTFPRGISVPDPAESEEDELDSVAATRSSPYPPSYGSQANPVNVDDFEDPSRAIMYSDSSHVEIDISEQSPAQRQPQPQSQESERATSPAASLYAQAASANQLPLYPLESDTSDDDEAEGQDYPDEEEDDQEMSTSEIDADSHDEVSDEESVDNSDVESLSESDASDNREDDMDAVRRVKLGEMLNHEQQKPATPVPVTPAAHIEPPTSSNFQSSPSAQAYPKLPDPSYFHATAMLNHATRPVFKENEPERFRDIEPASMFTEPYSNTWDHAVGPSLPRPAAPKPMGWEAIDYSSPVLMREAPHDQNPWFDEAPGPFFPTNDYNRNSMPLYNRTHAYMPVDVVRPQAIYRNPPPVDASFPPATGAPTPPTSNPDEFVATPPQTTPRTKVSIAEIVEDAQAPPTPSLKRKADVLDEPVTYEDSSTQAVPEQTDIIATTSTSVASLSPPKKKARTALGTFTTGIATGIVLGGAAVISALFCTPEQVFEQWLSAV